jgi:hypothetical protein
MGYFYHFRPNQGGTFFRWGVLFLLFVIVLAVVFAALGMNTARWGMSECLQWQGSILSDRFILSESESEKMIAMIQKFAQQIEAGKVSPRRGFEVLRAFSTGPVTAALLHGSIIRHLRSLENLDETHFTMYQTASQRFFLGVKSGKIVPKDWDSVFNALMENRTSDTTTAIGMIIPEQIRVFHRKIGLAALLACLEKMIRITGNADLPPMDAEPDPVMELSQVLKIAAGAAP